MKKIFSLLVVALATMTLSAQTFKVTWNLDGGCANPMCATNKAELFNAFMTDCGLMGKLETDGVTYDSLLNYVKQNPENPCKNNGIGKYLTNTNALSMPQWAWLKAYIISVLGNEPAAGSAANYEVGAFWMSCQNTTWPKSSDYTLAGKDSAYVPVMNAAGQYYAYPTEVAADFVLPTPTRAEYDFIGWYNGDTKVEQINADMALTAKWKRTVYNVDFVAPFAYPNPLYSNNKDMMYAELNADYNVFYNVESNWGTLSTFTAITDGMPTHGSKFDLTFFADSTMKAKWGWLLDYCDTICTRQAQTLPSSNPSFMRYNVNAFFMNSVRSGWPVSADYATCGVDAEDWKAVWGYELTLPDTIAADYTLPKMYRKNYEFQGWFWNADFSGDVVTVVPVKSNGTLYAKFAPTDKALLGIALSKTDTVALQMPNTDQLTVIFTPETAANKKVVWSSSNEAVLVVDQNGLVTPKAPGKATVKVVSDESKLEASVEYEISAAPGAVTGVALDQTSVTLEMGKTIQLVATIAPEDAVNKNIIWTSNSKAATVDSTGLVKADTVGTATITATTADGGYTATCVVTVPEPLDEILVEKLWEVAIPTKVADISDVRNGMGWNGKFYLTDKKAQKVRVFTKDGEDTEAAIAMPDSTISLGTGIAIDDAGNIVLGTNFPNAVTSMAIIKHGETTPKLIELALPTPARCDQITAFGDIFSEEGGLVYFYTSGATQLQYAKVVNGVLDTIVALNGTVTAGSSPAQVLYGTETTALANPRGAKAMQWVENGVVTDILPKNAITNDLGGAVMFFGGDQVWAYKVGTTHSTEFSVRNMTTQQFAADKDGNTVHYIIDQKAASNNSYANFTKAEKINDYAYYLNVFTSGKGAAVYKVYKDVPVESIVLDTTSAELKAGDKFQLNATITPAYATVQDVEWSTSDSAVAVVDQNGLVQAIGAGEATITVTTTDGTNLSATCNVTVKAVIYKKATSVDQLIAGKKMLIVNAGDSSTLGAAGKNNFPEVAITTENNTLTDVPAEATIITLVRDGDIYMFAVDGGYITATTSKNSNYLRIATEPSTLTQWNITIAEDGVAAIVCVDSTSERNTIRYNESSKLFSAYKTGTQKDVVIYIEYEPLTYNVTVPDNTPMCYIVGAMTNTWTNFVPMDMVDATHYTITLDNATKTDEYKYTCGPDWKFVEKNIDGSERGNRTWSENDVVEAWAEVSGVEDIQTDAAAAEKLFIDGQLYIIRGGVMYNANGAVVR